MLRSLLGITNAVIIGHTSPEIKCGFSGLWLPANDAFVTDGVKFINFDNSSCAAIVPCAECAHSSPLDVAFPSLFRNVEYVNSPNKVI